MRSVQPRSKKNKQKDKDEEEDEEEEEGGDDDRDVEDDEQENDEKRASKRARHYENIHLGTRNRPLCIIDCHGQIILWYLPYILSTERRVSRLTLCTLSAT